MILVSRNIRYVRIFAGVPSGWRLNYSNAQFLARDSIYAIAHYMLSPIRLSVGLSVGLSVCLFVTGVDQSKTVEVRITQTFTTD